MTIHCRAGAALALAMAALAMNACSSNNGKNVATSTRPPTSTSTSPASNGTDAANRQPTQRPPIAAPTLGTPDPALAALVQKLTPLLVQTPELPQVYQRYQQTGVFPESNADYGRGQPDAAEITARLDKDGRLGGAQTAWAPVGQFMPRQKVISSVVTNVSEFQSVDGAKDGLALIFSRITPSTTNAQGGRVKSAPLDLGSFGDESKAYRVEQMITASVAGTPAPTVEQVQQVIDIAAFRRGKAIAFVSIVGLNLDPSTGDVTQLLRTLDEKLKGAGY